MLSPPLLFPTDFDYDIFEDVPELSLSNINICCACGALHTKTEEPDFFGCPIYCDKCIAEIII